MNNKLKYLLLLVLAVLLIAEPADAKKKNGDKKQIRKTEGTPNTTKLNINNISTYLRSNGDGDLDNNSQAGFIFPKGSGKSAVFESGFLWGAKINGTVSVGGAAYSQGLQPGRILSPGVSEDPNLPKNRIYRVRPDYATANLSGEAVDEGVSQTEVFSQYQTDWNEWPAEDGAPYTDVDSNGAYDPNVDIPGVPGASQTIYFVANDLNPSLTQNLYGSQPMGVEMHATIWAYSQAGPLGNMFFRKYNIFNKSNDTFTDMYVSMFSDVDDGDAEDDFAGCDTTLSLGYVYNANSVDAVYKETVPPAVGFDFFQGPLIDGPGDSAIFHGQRVYGKKNLPMTAFYYFAKGDLAVTDPTTASYEGTLQFYNFMQGKIGKTGAYFTTPPNQGSVPTTFVLAGDPVTGTGWVDGQLIQAGDRRIGTASGPFTMAPGDEQEIVIAQIAAIGGSNLGSVTLLKNYDKVAQDAYDNFFKIPQGAQQPKVTATPLDQAVILSWGEEGPSKKTEAYDERGYKFEGYNVYQLPSASATKDEGHLLAAFDLVDEIKTIYGYVFDPRTGKDELVPVEFGTDAGIQRQIKIDRDNIRGEDLHNGSRYYFAVTSYSYNPDPLAVPNVIENPLAVITVVPSSPNPGVRYPSAYGDTIQAVHTGKGDGSVIAIVNDPSKLTGHQYKVNFSLVNNETVWSLTDVTSNKILLANQNNQSGDNNYFSVDGLQVKVAGPPPGMKDYDIPSGERKWTFAGGADALGLEGFSGAIGNAFNNWFSGSTVGLDQLKNVLIKFAPTDTLGNLLDPNDANVSYGYRYLRHAADPPAKPEFSQFIVNPADGYAFQDFKKNIPFAAFDVEGAAPRRLSVGYLENNVEGGEVDGKYWPPDYNTGDNGDVSGPREWFFIYNTDYSESSDPNLAVDILDVTTPMIWFGTAARRGNVSFDSGDEFLIIANHINTPEDEFTFTAPTVTTDNALAKSDIQKINVFPNPYYGVNSEEINKYQRFVTFNHLPRDAKIRIFNLAGGLVRTINKNSDSQFERWDLANNDGLPVASGLYIAHIEMPGLGEKILKLAIIQEQQILDRF